MNRVKRHEVDRRERARRELVQQGLTEDEAEERLVAKEGRDLAIDWLRSCLFGEEWDSHGDSYADAQDRLRGKNPMNEDYQARVAAKRAALGVPPLDAAGLATGSEAAAFCERLVDGIALRLSPKRP